ncbi:MAG: phosphatidylglycerophosphatase A [Candidatus Latescibacteria bacterium]|nr:phosphatidylglycerophosphatase A [Candidatus Latescibacterota bacterium]
MPLPLARVVATFGFVGHLPVAPGTWASLVTVVLWWRIAPAVPVAGTILFWILLLVAGTAASAAMERIYGHDDGRIVIDEVAGLLVAVAGFPRLLGIAIAAFVLFRLFDILKPPPVYQLQALPGGFGVMADDLAAGIYANLLLRLLLFLFPALAWGGSG